MAMDDDLGYVKNYEIFNIFHPIAIIFKLFPRKKLDWGCHETELICVENELSIIPESRLKNIKNYVDSKKADIEAILNDGESVAFHIDMYSYYDDSSKAFERSY